MFVAVNVAVLVAEDAAVAVAVAVSDEVELADVSPFDPNLRFNPITR
jgi:hypothetical protein